MWTSNETLNKTKVVDLEKLHKFGSQHFSFEPKKIEKILVYQEVPEISEIANGSLSPSPSLFPPPLTCTPPVDLVHDASAANWAQEGR